MTSSMPPSLRELNRTLLARQFLLERADVPVAQAVSSLLALQAQWAPSAYVALWSRLRHVGKDEVTRSPELVKASTLRGTLHVMARGDYPAIAAATIEANRGRTENLGVDVAALRQALPRRPLRRGEAEEIAVRVLGTDDRWTVAFALRALPFVRDGVAGPWPHTRPGPVRLWRKPLPDAQTSAVRVVRAFLAAYGPATRDDIQRFTNFRIRQIAPALDGLDVGEGLYDVPGAVRVSGRARAPVRFLPAFDSALLAHLYTGRLVPPEYVDAVYNRKNATCKSTFTVDGFVAGTWRIDGTRIVVEPFVPLPPRRRREVDDEAARLLAWWLDGEERQVG
jgi:winged helix DNA-binding protein